VGTPNDGTYEGLAGGGLLDQLVYSCDGATDRDCIASPQSHLVADPLCDAGNGDIQETTGHDIVKVCTEVIKLIVGAATSAAGPGRTLVKIYTPFRSDGSLDPGINVEGHGAGPGSGCWEGSIAADRRDAWRCSVNSVQWTDPTFPGRGTNLFDPCFENGVRPGELACAYDPTHVVLIELGSLPAQRYANSPIVGPYPWFMILNNGDRCSPETGAGNRAPILVHTRLRVET
jgi:hypothetical protein